MKQWQISVVMASVLFSTCAFSDCDLKSFRWECDMSVNVQLNRRDSSLVYCDNINVYVTPSEYDQIERYQRSRVDMSLMLNGEFFSGPCIPVQR